jgi:YesN/AraC family two-component response regulator
VLEASNGIEAIDIYSSLDRKIDLVILDLIMPKMGGDETFRRLKIVDPHLKALISSGYGIGERTKEMMKDSGVVGFIQKPFSISEVAETVKSVLPSA